MGEMVTYMEGGEPGGLHFADIVMLQGQCNRRFHISYKLDITATISLGPFITHTFIA